MGVDGNADPSGVAMGDIRFVHDRGVAGLLGSLPLAAPPVVRGDGGISCKCTRDGGIAGRSPTDAAGFANSFLQPRRAKTINQSINTSLKHAVAGTHAFSLTLSIIAVNAAVSLASWAKRILRSKSTASACNNMRFRWRITQRIAASRWTTTSWSATRSRDQPTGTRKIHHQKRSVQPSMGRTTSQSPDGTPRTTLEDRAVDGELRRAG
jgi:hypothetical protein